MSRTLLLSTVLLFVIVSAPLWGQSTTKDTTRIQLIRPMVSPSKVFEAVVEFNSGTQLLGLRMYRESIPRLQNAIRYDSTFVDAMDHLGIAYRNLALYDSAVYWYLKSLSIKPENPVALTNLGIAYLYQKKYKEAFNSYNNLLKLNPKDPEGYYGIGRVLQQTGDFANSSKAFQAATTIYIEQKSIKFWDAAYLQCRNMYMLKSYATCKKLIDLCLTHADYPDLRAMKAQIEAIEAQNPGTTQTELRTEN